MGYTGKLSGIYTFLSNKSPTTNSGVQSSNIKGWEHFWSGKRDALEALWVFNLNKERSLSSRDRDGTWPGGPCCYGPGRPPSPRHPRQEGGPAGSGGAELPTSSLVKRVILHYWTHTLPFPSFLYFARLLKLQMFQKSSLHWHVIFRGDLTNLSCAPAISKPDCPTESPEELLKVPMPSSYPYQPNQNVGVGDGGQPGK